MNISLMRGLDYLIGIPFCCLVTFWDKISHILIPRSKDSLSLKRILFIKLSEMGSIILAYPLIKESRNVFADSEIYFLTFKKNKPIVKTLSLCGEENIYTIRDDSLVNFVIDTFNTIACLRKEKIDIVFDLEFFSRATALFSYFSKASIRVGFSRFSMEGLYRGNLLTHRVNYNPFLHISETYLSLLQVFKRPNPNQESLIEPVNKEKIQTPLLQIKRKDKSELLRQFELNDIDNYSRIFLINLGDGNIPLRDWPIINFIKLGGLLLEDLKNRIILVGTDSAQNKAVEFMQEIKSKYCYDLSGKTSFEDLLSLCYVSDAFIASDSGAAHIAALTGIKTLVLFGPETPEVYSPLGKNVEVFYSKLACSPCLSIFNNRVSMCNKNYCLEIILPEDVSRAIKNKI